MSSYRNRYNHYLGPTRDYLTYGIFDDSSIERRRPVPQKIGVLRDDQKPRPFYMCPCLVEAAEAKRTFSVDDEDSYLPKFVNTYRRPLCTPDDLLKIIRKPEGHFQLPTEAYNEVFPDIYLGDALTAMSIALLKRLRITHILNAAQGDGRSSGSINTSEDFYVPQGIQYLGVPAVDNTTYRIHHHFEDAADFISDALKHGGKVLVHCQAGISRSATLICAFLMIKHKMCVEDAVKIIRKKRAIIPNKGFLQQLCDLNDKLKRQTNY
ncbi:dual specificity protein phosphatase 3-like [Parasteatoda tepidariorum]|nr:dual specificity protein phosphatase 3-like isoform X1 [Parasteatoda tepidariorum]XP_042901881.1 dual specificity protein phosphatase 3-like isoform X2 [Parasteatoda tepidariorum]